MNRVAQAAVLEFLHLYYQQLNLNIRKQEMLAQELVSRTTGVTAKVALTCVQGKPVNREDRAQLAEAAMSLIREHKKESLEAAKRMGSTYLSISLRCHRRGTCCR